MFPGNGISSSKRNLKTFTYIFNQTNKYVKVIILNEIVFFPSSTIFISFALEYAYTHKKYDTVTNVDEVVAQAIRSVMKGGATVNFAFVIAFLKEQKF